MHYFMIITVVIAILVIRKMPRLRFYAYRLLQNPIAVKRIMAVGTVVDI